MNRVQAITRNARMSAEKVVPVIRGIRGMKADRALILLGAVPRKSARLISRTLVSAIHSAVNNLNMDRDDLVIEEAVVGKARTIKRIRPRARGSAGPVHKRNCHIRIVVSDNTRA